MAAPHLERLCRDWAGQMADPALFVAGAAEVPPAVTASSVVVNDGGRRTAHEVEIMVMAQDPGRRPRVLSTGEAKWGETMSERHLDRLRRIRTLLQARDDVDATHAIPALYSATGFTDGLRAAAERGEALLVGLDDLYP